MSSYRSTAPQKIDPPTEADVALAKATFEWMESLVGSKEAEESDYLWNLSVYGKAGVVTAKGMGLVASAVSSFMRKQEEARRASMPAAAPSNYVGTEGERLTLRVTVTKVFPTTYGFMTKMVDEAGNVLGTFGRPTLCEGDRKGQAVRVGDVLWVKGTVKRHSEYKSVKETLLNRADSCLDPTVEKAQKAASAKANKRIETLAGEVQVLGASYPVYDITRASGEVVGWRIRKPAVGKKLGAAIVEEECGERFADTHVRDRDATTVYPVVASVIARAESVLRGEAREAFGEPKLVARWVALGYSDAYKARYPESAAEESRRSYQWTMGDADKLLYQTAESEWTLITGKAQYKLASPQAERFWTLAEAVESVEKAIADHTYRFERRDPTV